MNTELYKQIKDLICQVLEVPEDELGDNTHFIDELGIDSILIIELKTKFEEKYPITIDKDDLNELTSLSSIFNYLTNKKVSAA